MKLNVESLLIEFNDFGYENNEEDEMVGRKSNTLDIFYSINQANKSPLIATWLAADLVGGLINGISAAAVSAPTSAVGKIIKWLS